MNPHDSNDPRTSLFEIEESSLISDSYPLSDNVSFENNIDRRINAWSSVRKCIIANLYSFFIARNIPKNVEGIVTLLSEFVETRRYSHIRQYKSDRIFYYQNRYYASDFSSFVSIKSDVLPLQSPLVYEVTKKDNVFLNSMLPVFNKYINTLLWTELQHYRVNVKNFKTAIKNSENEVPQSLRRKNVNNIIKIVYENFFSKDDEKVAIFYEKKKLKDFLNYFSKIKSEYVYVFICPNNELMIADGRDEILSSSISLCMRNPYPESSEKEKSSSIPVLDLEKIGFNFLKTIPTLNDSSFTIEFERRKIYYSKTRLSVISMLLKHFPTVVKGTTPDTRESLLSWKPQSVFHSMSEREKFDRIVEPSLMVRQIEDLEHQLTDVKNSILEIDEVPKNWNDTKKAWLEKNQSKRQNLAKRRDELSQMITRFRNGTLENNDTVLLKKTLDAVYVQQNKKYTENQLQQYISLLENKSFDSVTGLDYYPTPPDIVQKALNSISIQCGDRVLEPSAGKGNFLDAVKSAYGDCISLYAIELSAYNREILELKGYDIIGDDFLQFAVVSTNKRGIATLDPSVKFDKIVMNPPFMKGMDYVHLQKAFELLKEDGELVAILPASSYVGLGREATSKRNFIERNGGSITIIKADEYNKNMEFTQLTIDIALVTLKKMAKEEYVSSLTKTESSSYSKYMELPNKGVLTMPKRMVTDIDTGYVKPEIVTAQEQFVKKDIPDYFRQIHSSSRLSLFDHQRFGVNKGIHALLTSPQRGFLLGDGTGAGKTIQMLTIAAYFWQTTGKPVTIFTIDDKIIRTSFMQDGIKMGFSAPEYSPVDEQKPIQRPKNYMGLYDTLNDKPSKKQTENKTLPPIYYGVEKTLSIRNGINMFTYNALSLIKDSDDLNKKLRHAHEKEKENSAFWRDVLSTGMESLKGEPVNPKIKDNIFEYLKNNNIEVPETIDLRKSTWKELVLSAGTDDTKSLQKAFASLVGLSVPSTEKAAQNLVKVQDEYARYYKDKLKEIFEDSSLVIFDEAHKIKNLLLNTEKQSGRAFFAKIITDNAERVMFATATPCDRPYDILYLSRAGLFEDAQDFVRKMALVGVYYQAEKRDSEGNVVRRGRWFTPKNSESLTTANYSIGELFDFITRKGNMLRREIQYTNLDVSFIDVIVPHSIIKQLEFITSSLKYKDDRGREVVDKTKELQRHQEAVEEYKLDEVVSLTKKEIAEGRNVIIFTSMVDEGTQEREDGSTKIGSVRILKNRLSELYGSDAVGVLVSANSEYEKYRRLEFIDQFQKGVKRILIATITSGGTGTNLDDQLGNAPRTIICVTAPLSFINVMQGIGRVVRANTKSRSRAYFVFAKTDHPNVAESHIPVELWLKNLIGSKFKTLHAAVKGEVAILNPEEVQRVESAGESGAAALIEMNSEKLSAREHSLYKKTGSEYNGWDMPTKSAISIKRVGTSYSHQCFIRARSKEELYAWAQINKDFIDKWNLQFNIDENFRRYHGSHYGKSFYTHNAKDWKESYELWNAMLNLIKPEEFKYMTNEYTAYEVGDKIIATTDLLSTDTKIGSVGTIVDVIPVTVGQNENGNIIQYRYDVEWSNKKVSMNLFGWQIKPDGNKYMASSKYKIGDLLLDYTGDRDSERVFKELSDMIKSKKTTFEFDYSERYDFSIYRVVDIGFDVKDGEHEYVVKSKGRDNPINVVKIALGILELNEGSELRISESELNKMYLLRK